jgi:outer membrane protein
MMTALLVGLAVAGFADSTARPITLAQAVALAQQNDPSAVSAHGQVRTTKAGVRTAYGAFIPSVSLSAGANRQLPSQSGRTRIDSNGQVVTLPSEPWSYNVGLGANVALFQGGARFFDLRQAKARASAAEANEVAQQYDVALAVKVAFFDILAERETEAAARAQLEQAEQQRVTSVARVRALEATRSDSLRSDIQVRTAQIAILDARNALALAEATLTRAVGTPYLVTADPADSVEVGDLVLTDEQLRAFADESPNVIQARKSLEAARFAAKSAWTDYLPSLTMGYSRSGSGTSAAFAPLGTDYDYNGSVRFSLSFPLFNQFQREAGVTSAKVAVDNAEAQLRDAQLAARQGLTQSLGTFRSADEKLAAQEATVAAAEEDLRVQYARYRVGGSTLLDVLTSQTQLDQARRDLIRARYDKRVSRAQLEALVGRDL